jgi:hypothetical protein
MEHSEEVAAEVASESGSESRRSFEKRFQCRYLCLTNVRREGKRGWVEGMIYSSTGKGTSSRP